MKELSKIEKNKLSFFCIYNMIVFSEMKMPIDVKEIVSNQTNLPYEDTDFVIKECLINCLNHYDEIKTVISNNLINWSYDRLSTIKKAILMYGITNNYYIESDMNKAIIIDQCIVFAKKFGETKDSGFINAILDKVLK